MVSKLKTINCFYYYYLHIYMAHYLINNYFKEIECD